MLSYFAGGQYTGRMDARPPCGAVHTLRKGAGPLWAQAGDGPLVWNEASPDGHEAIKLSKGTEPPVPLLDIGATRGDGALRIGRTEPIPHTTDKATSISGKQRYPPEPRE